MSFILFLALLCLLIAICFVYLEIRALSDHILDLNKDFQKSLKKGKK